MLDTLYFTNPGEIDIRGATIAGLSAKDSPSSAIGFFGTGLKYAIASVLRWNGSITIYSGMTQYRFEAEPINFRDREFMQIVMKEWDANSDNGPPTIRTLGFTTEYGKTWLPWQVFRELYANALDEGGRCDRTIIDPSPGITIVEVQCPEVFAEFANRDSIILPRNKHWDATSNNVQFALQPSTQLYYKGVRVGACDAALTYNVLSDLGLTEDRTLASMYSYRIRITSAVMVCGSESICTVFIKAACSDNNYESNCEFAEWGPTSETFLSVARRLYQQSPHKYRKLESLMKTHAPELCEPAAVQLSPIRKAMLERAIAFVSRMGRDTSIAPIIVAELGEDLLGQYNQRTNKIYLSPTTFAKGTKEVVSTLYEEILHAETGKQDCTYNLQTHLFETIVSLYEEHVFKEPI